MLVLGLTAGADVIVITLKDGTVHIYSVDEVESITFQADAEAATMDVLSQGSPHLALRSIIGLINSDNPEAVLDYIGHPDGSGPLTSEDKESRRNPILRDLMELAEYEFSIGDVFIERESEGDWHVIPAEISGESETLYFAFLEHNGKWYLCDIDD